MNVLALIKAGVLARKGFKAWRNRRRAKKGLPPKEGVMKGAKTYTGIAVFALATVLGWLGIGGEAEASQIVQQGGQLLGTLLAIYGRWDATRVKG